MSRNYFNNETFPVILVVVSFVGLIIAGIASSVVLNARCERHEITGIEKYCAAKAREESGSSSGAQSNKRKRKA